MTSKVRHSRRLLAWIAILLVAFAVRVIPIAAAKPYMAYVDEGNFLHPVVRLLHDGGWDPHDYMYPQFPIVVVTAAVRAAAPLYRATHGRSLREDLSFAPELYDELEPFEVLLIARILSVVLGLAIVSLTGLFAYRLGGWSAGLGAALLAALIPALALRGSIATVDSYATLFVLACLILTDSSRTSSRPALAALLAGASSGCAFASKYPSVVVLAAFGVTTLLEPIGGREKLRRATLAGLGLLAGAALAMPAVVLHPRAVLDAIRSQAAIYGQMASPHLWGQAVLRAEWNLPYERAEVGFVFLALAVAGFVLGLRDPRLRPTYWGWSAFGAIGLWMYSRQVFQPFRNLLPMVPLACVAVAILFARFRQRLRRALWVDAVALAWVLAFFGVPLAGYDWKRMHLIDSRVQAMDWLVANARDREQVLFVRELGFLNQELARPGARPTVCWWDEAEPEIPALRPRFLVAGILNRQDGLPIDVATLPAVKADYALRARFGESPTAKVASWWRGNRQIIYLLERRPGASGG